MRDQLPSMQKNMMNIFLKEGNLKCPFNGENQHARIADLAVA